MAKQSVMVVDDTRANLKLLGTILQNAGHVVRALPGAAMALESIKTQAPDLILLDILMPEMSGFEMCRKLKSDPAVRDIPVIFISSKIDVEDKIEAFSVGGVDYITKPFQDEEVLVRVNTHLTLARTQQDLQVKNQELCLAMARRDEAVAEQNRLIEELEHLAITDRLTGLYNRAKLDDSLTNEHGRVLRSDSVYSLIIIDVDKFKRVNDTYGHQTGDIVLKEMAKLMSRSARKTDTIGRWGGEEFLIICPDTTESGAAQLAEKLRKSIEDYQFPVEDALSSSFGVAGFRPGDSIEDIIGRADDALYAAKSNGRNRVEVAS